MDLKKRKRIILRTLAFAKKEFRLNTRYKLPYLTQNIIMPLLQTFPLIILYWGITTLGTGEWGSVTADNYLAWVLLGVVGHSLYIMGYTSFRISFSHEKYWMTIHGVIIAPASKYYLLFGSIIELCIRGMVTSTLFIIISYIVYPTSIINVFMLYGLLLLLLIAGAGISLVNGTFYLINENIAPIFDYALYIIIFTSCWYIPYVAYPPFLHIIILANPIFHFINLYRDIWIFGVNLNSLWSFCYILIFSIACMLIGLYIFSKFTRKFGIRGY